MDFPNKRREAGANVYTGSIIGLANTVAAALTFLATPTVYGSTIGWVTNLTIEHYGRAWTDLASFGWFVLCACFIFFISRASVATALVVGGLAIAARVFV